MLKAKPLPRTLHLLYVTQSQPLFVSLSYLEQSQGWAKYQLAFLGLKPPRSIGFVCFFLIRLGLVEHSQGFELSQVLSSFFARQSRCCFREASGRGIFFRVHGAYCCLARTSSHGRVFLYPCGGASDHNHPSGAIP